MARFKPSPDGLTVLRAGLCPDCGAVVGHGLVVCRACGLDFGEYAHELPGPKARAAASAPPAPPSGGAAALGASLSSSSSPQADRPAPRASGMTVDDVAEFERGVRAVHALPLTHAEAPDVARVVAAPLLGAALARGAGVVMAEAAVADEPLALLGHPAASGPVPRAALNLRRAAAAAVDEPGSLVTPAPSPTRPTSTASTTTTRTDAPAPGRSRGVGQASAGLSLDDIERLERPLATGLPGSFAEAADAWGADPGAGLASLRGPGIVMADAGVADDPLVLLGYPPLASPIARAAIHQRRSDAACVDDAWLLARRPATAAARPSPAPPAAPAATAPPSGAPPVGARRQGAAPLVLSSGVVARSVPSPQASPSGSPTVRPLPGSPAPTTSSPRVPAASPIAAGPAAGRANDTEVTVPLAADAIQAAKDAALREQRRLAHHSDPQRPPRAISGRGGARSLDE